jgi:hypothetical protein
MTASRRSLLTLAVAACVVVAACGSSGSTATPDRTTTTSRRPTTSTGPAGEGTTAWVDVSATWKAMAPSSMSTNPHEVADDLAALRRGQGGTSDVGEVSVVEVRSGEPAVVVLAETGGGDPAVAKVETEITLEPGEGGWTVGTARQRSTCFRAPASADAATCPPISG